MCRCVFVHILQQKAISHVWHYLPGTWEKHAWAHSYTHTHEQRSSQLLSPRKILHIWHVGSAHVQTSTNTLSHFSQAVLALTQSVQGIFESTFLPTPCKTKLWLPEQCSPKKTNPHVYSPECKWFPRSWCFLLPPGFPVKPRTFTSTNVISTYFCTCDALRSHHKSKKKKKTKK